MKAEVDPRGRAGMEGMDDGRKEGRKEAREGEEASRNSRWGIED